MCINKNKKGTSSYDKTIKVWDLRKTTTAHVINTHAPVQSLSFDHSGQYLVAGCENSVCVYNFASKSQVVSTVELHGHSSTVTSALASVGMKNIVSTSMDKTVKLWQPR
eukprot:GHVR01031621.1.p1 GENE.GHVR01031621.1~~GHVR01031621.1.p1  ORF type:complete len:109 (+),score=19.00 GHVR01031621.1:39-365(+)